MPLAFHASPPAGQWFNDPNALFTDDDGYHLLVQHREDGPAFQETGWGLLSSTDLLDWRWKGVALAPGRERWAYSGSLVSVGPPEIFHTVHDLASGMQHQVRLVARDRSLRAWEPIPAASLAGPARNVRDPFVFAHEGGWRMLLARPCDWRDWPEQAASELLVLASDDRSVWREAGRIGPWQPAGVMWEVPVLLERAGRHLLLISTVDRRGGGADCGVRGWSGRFDGGTFHPDDPVGTPVDFGPDFYAAMAGVGRNGESPCVGWLSSWATAREPVWPDFAGGPIALPRAIGLGTRGAPTNRPWADRRAFEPVDERPEAGVAEAVFDGAEPFALTLTSGAATLLVTADPRDGTLMVSRQAAPPFGWTARHTAALAPAAKRTLTLFVDGPAIEVFIDPEGRAASVVLPGGLRATSLRISGADLPLVWSAYAPAARRSSEGDTP